MELLLEFRSLSRPLQLLYPLETNHSNELGDAPKVTQESQNKEIHEPEQQDQFEEQPIHQPRPQRNAALRGEERRGSGPIICKTKG